MTVQWLRAFAALLVLAEHTKNEIAVHYLGLGGADPRFAVFPFPAGVDVFFVISGFVMAWSSASLYGQPGAARRFLLRRAARIVPLYWLATLALVAIFAAVGRSAWHELTLGDVIASLAFVPTAGPYGEGLPILVAGWTLNHEMFFYVLFAFCIGLPERSALLLVSLLLVALVACGWLLAPTSFPFGFWLSPIVLEFVAGIALYGLYARGLRLPAAVRLALLAMGLALFFVNAGTPSSGWSRLGGWGIAATLLVAAAVFGAAGSSARPSARVAELAGNLSYGVYLLHLIVLLFVRNLVEAALPRTDWAWFGVLPAAVLVATVACAFILFRTVEQPFLRWAKRATGLRLTQGPGAPPGP